jgi:hypothetical protein
MALQVVGVERAGNLWVPALFVSTFLQVASIPCDFNFVSPPLY